MPISGLKTMLAKARDEKYAVGAFEVWNLESIQVVIAAAEDYNKPVIIQFGSLEMNYSGIYTLSRMAIDLARNSQVEVAVHLDHGDSYELALQSIHAGLSSVMYDGSHLSFEENVAQTKEIVKGAHAAGVDVEAELGRLSGVEGNISVKEEEAFYTDPDEAVRYVELTGVDALAVAIGTGHGYYKKKPNLDLTRLEQIAQKVSIPLVLHGGSQTPEDKIRRAIELGISKVNICTEFVDAFGRGISESYNDPECKISVPGLFNRGKEYALDLVKEKIKLFSLL